MTTPNFAQYIHPGVYVEAGSSPTVAVSGVAPTVVCLVGSGVGYHTYSETVSFAGGVNTVTLTQKGINPASIVVKGYVTDPNASGQSIPYTFAKDETGTPHDYSVATNTTGGTENSTTTITRSSGGKIEDAYPQVTVSYQYTDSTYFQLNFFEDFASIADTYGPALDPVTGALVSPLTFAAQCAITNGANQVYTLAVDPSKGTVSEQFADAYQTLSASSSDVNVVVPLWSGVTDPAALAGMLATLNAALAQDAAKGVLRFAMVGLDQNYTGAAADVAALASGISSTRIALAYPNQLNFFNGVTNTSTVVDGYYLAAACAGILVAQQPQMPLTNKVVTGFSGFPAAVARAMTPTNKDTMAKGGVMVVELNRQNQLKVRHGLTTNYAGGVLLREISLVRAQDALYDLLQTTMEASGLIGIPIDSTTALSVKSIVAGALENAKSATVGLIVDYNQLAVREQAPPSGDPTVIEVRFAYKPSWPLNYILVSFTVDTSNGSVSDTSATTA